MPQTFYDEGFEDGIKHGILKERAQIAGWLRRLDKDGGDITRFLPTTLANWIEEQMHYV